MFKCNICGVKVPDVGMKLFIWKCPRSGLLDKIMNFAGKGHTTLLTAEDGTELVQLRKEK